MKYYDKEARVVYLDNHLLVALKPAGLLTQKTDAVDESLEEDLKKYLKEKFHKPGAVFLHAVQRLDKPVSGLVLFARTSKALSRLNAALRNKQIKKYYQALVEGHLEKKEGTLKHWLVHGSHRAEIASEKKANAKLAVLHFKVLKTIKQNSLVEIELETGRYHQIRAQFAAIGHPIVGDAKYRSLSSQNSFAKAGVGQKTEAISAIKLHAVQLELVHPVTKVTLNFSSLPDFLDT